MFSDMLLFVDRVEAGKKLASQLLDESLVKTVPKEQLLVLSIPRGGVVVGAIIAQTLHCMHEVVVVKKIGFPGYEEMAIGALTEDGTVLLNDLPTFPNIECYIDQKSEAIKLQIEANIQKFRQGRALTLRRKTVILVDDGIATGETMKAAVTWLKSKDQSNKPDCVLVAAPVCSPPAAAALGKLADKLVCVAVPQQFWAVGQFYWDFDQISDEEAVEYLKPDKAVGE